MSAVRTKLGYLIVVCPGCNASPVRLTESATSRSLYNWLLQCPQCGVHLCRVCFPDGAVRCESCDRDIAALADGAT